MSQEVGPRWRHARAVGDAEYTPEEGVDGPAGSREVTSEVDTQAIHAAALNATRATAPDLMMTRTGPMPAVRPARRGVFVAYSHRDRDLLGELQVHLKPLQKAWMLDLWDDIRVDHGPRGAAELRHAIDSARVALQLISPGFLASPFVEEHHLPVTLAAQTHPRAAVMCIYLRPAMDVFADLPANVNSLIPSGIGMIAEKACEGNPPTNIEHLRVHHSDYMLYGAHLSHGAIDNVAQFLRLIYIDCPKVGFCTYLH